MIADYIYPNPEGLDSMSLPNKSPSTQVFRMMLYQRALHPELFNIQDRRIIATSDYELEAWVMPGGHALRFGGEGNCVTEVVCDQDVQLPERGLIHALPCIGEKEHEQKVGPSINFVTAVQTENLSDNLYLATYNEMQDFAEQSSALTYAWQDGEGANNLTVLDLQRYKGEVHAQSYHLIGSGGFVLRTQTIFELL